MALLGHATTGSTHGSTLPGDRKWALKVQAPEDGTITALYVDMQNDGIDIQAFRAGVYNDASIIANATLISAGDIKLLAPGALRAWVGFDSGIAAPIAAGSFYWLVLQAGSAGGNGSFWYDPGVGNQLIADDIFADGMAATFGTPISQVANSVAIYASYVPAASLAANRGLSRILTYAGYK
jgi:hypothetical protein